MSKPKRETGTRWPPGWTYYPAFILIIVLLAVVLLLVFVVKPALEGKEYVYPTAPSTWNGASIAFPPTPTPAPNPFPISLDDFIYIAENLEGWESEPDCGYTDESYDRYGRCIFKGPGLKMTVYGYAGGGIDRIEFQFDRHNIRPGVQMFNQIVWDTGLEKQAERARYLVDSWLDKYGYAEDVVDRIVLRTYFAGSFDQYLTIDFMVW